MVYPGALITLSRQFDSVLRHQTLFGVTVAQEAVTLLEQVQLLQKRFGFVGKSGTPLR